MSSKIKVVPSMIQTSQGQGRWADGHNVAEVILGKEEVRANMLKRCHKAMLNHKHGAKADEHPETRTYRVTGHEAFYRHGGTQMVRVTMGDTGEIFTVSNANESHRVKIELANVQASAPPKKVKLAAAKSV
jgi:hypothetical protein